MRNRIVILILVLLTASCSNSARKAEQSAEKFLESFIGNDFGTAKTFCNEEISKILSDTEEKYKAVPDNIRAEVEKLAGEASFQILGTEKFSRDSAVVRYSLKISKDHDAIEKTLTLKNIDKEWTIIRL